MFIDFRERGMQWDREEEMHGCDKKTSVGCLSHALRLETAPATQARALTFQFMGWCSNQLSPTSRGLYSNFYSDQLSETYK